MIRLSNVQKTYPARRGSDEHTALRGIDLDIAAGEIVGVIGRLHGQLTNTLHLL